MSDHTTRLVPVVILAATMLLMLGILLYVGRWMLFWRDEWDFVFYRADPSPSSILAPFFDTLAAVPVVAYQTLLAVFGLRTYLPYLMLDWLAHFAIAFLLYRIIARRCGTLLGVVAGVSMVFHGSGFEVLLQPFQIQYQFAMAGGLVAVDQLDLGRPRVASIALVPAVLSSGLGVIFAGTIIVWGVLRRRRSLVAATLPAIGVYGAWYATWGQQSGHLTGQGLSVVEGIYSVLFGIGAAVVGVIGLPPAGFALVGLAVAAAVACCLVLAARRGYRPDPLAAAAVAALIAEQALRTVLRAPYGAEYGARSAYTYAAAVFVLLAVAGLVGRRLPTGRRAVLVAAVAVTLMSLGNMRQFAGAAVELRGSRATELAQLELVESLRSTPGLILDKPFDRPAFYHLRAGLYLAAIDRFGRPTLAYDWRPYVDIAVVQETRQSLLPGSP